MMKPPTTIADIDDLLRNAVPEDLHLDYKSSKAIDASKRAEIAKDVSAFANSDGGILVYGVAENNHILLRIPASNGLFVGHAGIIHGLRRFHRQIQFVQQVIAPSLTVLLIPVPHSLCNVCDLRTCS